MFFNKNIVSPELSVNFSNAEDLLLKTIIGDKKTSRESFYGWKSITDLDRLGTASQKMLPLLYKTLIKKNIEDDILTKLKGSYRNTWVKNQLLFNKAKNIISRFNDAGLKVMVLKGAAICNEYYHDLAIRPMNDFDIMVRTEDAAEAIKILLDNGWKQTDASPKLSSKFNCDFFETWHSQGFRDKDNQEIDIHWHLLQECCYQNADDDFWNSAKQVEFMELPVFVLNPADQLLHLFVHGINSGMTEAGSILRWVTDAYAVINSESEDIDWERLCEQSIKRKLVLPVKLSLNYMSANHGIEIPQNIIDKLNKTKVDRIELLDYKAKTKSIGVTGYLPILWLQYLRIINDSKKRSYFKNLFGFIKFLKKLWVLKHSWMVPIHFIIMSLQRVRKSLAF